MKVLGMGVPELLIILAVVLLIFGPKHLPKLGAALGSTVKNLREGLGGNKKEDLVEEIVEEEEESPIERIPAKKMAGKTTKAKRKPAAETEVVAD